MQGLYPIIRRKRRPLLVADTPPVVLGNVEPVNMSHEEAPEVKMDLGNIQELGRRAKREASVNEEAE